MSNKVNQKGKCCGQIAQYMLTAIKQTLERSSPAPQPQPTQRAHLKAKASLVGPTKPGLNTSTWRNRS